MVKKLLFLCTGYSACSQMGGKIWPGLNQPLHWSFEAPAAFEGPHEAKLEKFREIRDQIDRRIQAWLAEKGYPNGNTASA